MRDSLVSELNGSGPDPTGIRPIQDFVIRQLKVYLVPRALSETTGVPWIPRSVSIRS